MPGFCGVVNLEKSRSQAAAQDKSDRMAAALWSEKPVNRTSFANDYLAVVLDELPRDGATDQARHQTGGDWTSLLFGEIWDDENAREIAYRGKQYTPDNDPGYLLNVFLSHGVAGFARLSGSFTAVLSNVVTGDVLLVTDPFGTRSVFYAEGPHELLFSSSLMPLLAVNSALRDTLDWVAIGEFLTMDYSLGDRTPLEEVRLIPPAHVMRIRNGKVSLERYWTMEYSRGNAPADYREQVRQFEEILLETFPRIAAHRAGTLPIGSFLSGGLDSRTVVGVAGMKNRILTHTFGVKGNQEVSFAAMVAREAGTRHYRYVINPENGSHAWPLGVRLTDGMVSCRHFHGLGFYPLMAERSPFMLDGFLGGHMTGCLIKDYRPVFVSKSPFIDALFENTAIGIREFKQLLSNGSSGVREDLTRSVYEDFCRVMEKITAETSQQRAEIFNFTNRQVKLIAQASARMCGTFMHMKYPFASRKLLDLYLSLPPDSLEDQRLYKDAIRDLMPRLAAIPSNTAGGPMLPPTAPVAISYLGHRIRRRLHRTVRSLAPRHIKPLPGSYPPYGWWIRTDLRNLFVHMLLSPDSCCTRYFNRAALASILESHTSGRENHELILSGLMAFELWHRMYIDGISLETLTGETEHFTGIQGKSQKRVPADRTSLVTVD